ncbi:phosphatase PAP2 family protein [Undibacterium rugosum]|uniref:phosphatase PAP2 family protein n=1 Tax=Undibacterium rugosum TaxID=2762291 RepID=UPI001B844BA5|nr:phosphatase PAP2 family protein [Undibacterium rugosum]MBR7778957.1 phosphatase PAP2 family protein [Undibacterium rugosum]
MSEFTEISDAKALTPERTATPSLMTRLLVLNALSFTLIYLTTNWLAAVHQVSQHLMLAADASIPLIPWMIIPYSSSLVLFVFIFYHCGTQQQCRQYSLQIFTATHLAGMCFLLMPLRQQHAAVLPEGWLGFAFQSLYLMDQRYNQLPSLHVAYALIFWFHLRTAMRTVATRFLLNAGIALLIASTLFTHQHHLADVITGAALGWLCICLCKPHEVPPVAAYYCITAAWLAVLALYSQNLWLFLLTATSLPCLLLVAQAYARGDRHFLHKRQGQHLVWVRLLYAPYLTGYRLSWLLQRYVQPAIRIQQITPLLAIGPRLRNAEISQLHPAGVVIDLSAELPEHPALCSPLAAATKRYLHYPLLDILPPHPQQMQELAALILPLLEAGTPVYLHCAMGFHRCRHIARYLTSH